MAVLLYEFSYEPIIIIIKIVQLKTQIKSRKKWNIELPLNWMIEWNFSHKHHRKKVFLRCAFAYACAGTVDVWNFYCKFCRWTSFPQCERENVPINKPEWKIVFYRKNNWISAPCVYSCVLPVRRRNYTFSRTNRTCKVGDLKRKLITM